MKLYICCCFIEIEANEQAKEKKEAEKAAAAASQSASPAPYTPDYAAGLVSPAPAVCLVLACLFERKSQAIVIARSSSLSSSCKNFNVAHYSKSI